MVTLNKAHFLAIMLSLLFLLSGCGVGDKHEDWPEGLESCGDGTFVVRGSCDGEQPKVIPDSIVFKENKYTLAILQLKSYLEQTKAIKFSNECSNSEGGIAESEVVNEHIKDNEIVKDDELIIVNDKARAGHEEYPVVIKKSEKSKDFLGKIFLYKRDQYLSFGGPMGYSSGYNYIIFPYTYSPEFALNYESERFDKIKEKHMKGITHTTDNLAVKKMDISLCGQYGTCLAKIAYLKNDINICGKNKECLSIMASIFKKLELCNSCACLNQFI